MNMKCIVRCCMLGLLMVIGVFFFMNGPALAHTDPPGSTSFSIFISLHVFRNDGITPVLPGTATECETIKVQATLARGVLSSDAAFEQGTWTITMPDGSVVDVTPPGGIPCVGGTTDDPSSPGGRGQCANSPTLIYSDLITYQIKPGDVAAGNVVLRTDLTDAYAHIGPNDLFGVNVGVPIATFVETCDDGLFCNGLETCDPDLVWGIFGERLGGCVSGEDPCPDDFFCKDVTCDEELDMCIETDVSDTQCPPDAYFCADNVCDEDQDACVQTDKSDTVCPPDLYSCADNICDEALDACVQMDKSRFVCPEDLYFCSLNYCDEELGDCVQFDKSDVVCPPEAYYCADNACDEDLDMCVLTDKSATVCPPDAYFCADNVCNEDLDTCVQVPKDLADLGCDPNCDYCDEEARQCRPIDPPPPYCVNIGICRTPRFWGTHSGSRISQNITQAVIDYAGGCLEICGEYISNTGIKNDESALEALCTRPRGIPRVQLARQLTALSLNCIMSGGGMDCSGTGLAGLFAACNMLCATGTSNDPSLIVNSCIEAVNCFNNGGIWHMDTSYCQMRVCSHDYEIPCNSNMDCGYLVDDTMTYSQCVPIPDNCHVQPLCNEGIGLCFVPPGPAGSKRRCYDATKSNCTLIGPGSANCAEVDECD